MKTQIGNSEADQKRRRLIELLTRVQPSCLDVEVAIWKIHKRDKRRRAPRASRPRVRPKKIMSCIMRAFQIDKDRPMAYLQITTDTAAAATTTKVTKYDPNHWTPKSVNSNPTSGHIEVKILIQPLDT